MATLNSLRQLQYLVTLSEKLNFTRAAAACFVTQSTLSAGLRELEKVLGARLVERDRQTVLMTPIGL
jgi:LysR family hydrogen peroxide-inducible transcriptional activator